MTTATITFNNITEIGKNELAISGLKGYTHGYFKTIQRIRSRAWKHKVESSAESVLDDHAQQRAS